MEEVKNQPELKFDYINWEGKRAVRRVRPIEIWYGKTEWHPKNGWLLRALDLDKNEERNFSLSDIIKFL
jgi:predicted DNA-binding transcriptional regulator YafY